MSVYNNLIDFFQYEISYFFVEFSIYKKKLGVNIIFFCTKRFYKNQERHLKKGLKKAQEKKWGKS